MSHLFYINILINHEIIMQLSFATNYSSLDARLKIVQAHAIAKEYVIVKSRSKVNYKFDVVAKVNIACERNDKSRRKLETKQRKTISIKCDCFFKINVIYKQSLNVWTTNVRNAKHNYENNATSNVFAIARKSKKKRQKF